MVFSCLLLVLLVSELSCASSKPKQREKTKAELRQAEALDALQTFLAGLIADYQQRSKTGDPTGSILLRDRIATLRQELRARIHQALSENIAQQMGMPPKPRDETVKLEAIDEAGNPTEVQFTTTVRPLRSLTEAAVARSTSSLLETDGIALRLYNDIPDPLKPTDALLFRRHYVREAAEAIAMEARLIIELKGGLWNTEFVDGVAANALAIRGLDLDRGLSENSNRTYDDTLYMILEYQDNPTEVYEYRMTTESSSTEKGVGRLQSRQVIYIRGLHRGKDPAFRLEGNAAKGTRLGSEGVYDITGANIHSAYTSRIINSDTPLSPNVSLGCQVIAASKTDFEENMITLLDSKRVARFPYTIVGNDEIQYLDQLLREKGKTSVLVRALPRKATGTS